MTPSGAAQYLNPRLERQSLRASGYSTVVPRRQATTGAVSHLLLASHRVTLRLAERLVAKWSASMLTRSIPSPDTHGALFEAPSSGTPGHVPPSGVTGGVWVFAVAGWLSDYDAISAGCATSFAASFGDPGDGVLSGVMEASER